MTEEEKIQKIEYLFTRLILRLNPEAETFIPLANRLASIIDTHLAFKTYYKHEKEKTQENKELKAIVIATAEAKLKNPEAYQ